MKNREKHSNEENRIDREAAEWVVKQDDGLSAAEQDAFFQWLADDPLHGERYARHGQSLLDANLLAEWRPEHSLEPNPDLLAHHRFNRPWIKWGGGLMAAAASIALILSLSLNVGDPNLSPEALQDAHFVADAYQYQVLNDGSQLDLNEGSEVEVHYTSEKRLVKLLAGEVYFKVAKNPDRPFVVEVNGTEVSALGTAFNIRYQIDAVEVVVTEGRVRWERPLDEDELSEIEDEGRLFYRELVSGQKSIITSEDDISDDLVIEAIQEEEIESILDWRHEVLDFESTPLSVAIEEFNRRNKIQLAIADPVLLDEPIVGLARSDNVEGFVLGLETFIIGLEIDRSEPGKIVLRKESENQSDEF